MVSVQVNKYFEMKALCTRVKQQLHLNDMCFRVRQLQDHDTCTKQNTKIKQLSKDDKCTRRLYVH